MRIPKRIGLFTDIERSSFSLRVCVLLSLCAENLALVYGCEDSFTSLHCFKRLLALDLFENTFFCLRGFIEIVFRLFLS